MSLACMPFVFATASKANWITLLTGVSHEKLQVFHRWIAHAFFVLALMHTFPFIVYHIRFHDMVKQVTMANTLFYWTGIVALVFHAWLTFASHSTIRKSGYEFFKAAHFMAVVVFVVIFFFHCDETLTSWPYFVGIAAVYVPCKIFSFLRTTCQYGRLRAHLLSSPNGFTRVTIPNSNVELWLPGQHMFLRFTGFGLANAWSTHPFTICSLPSGPGKQDELTFYIRPRRGLTALLHQSVVERPGLAVPVTVDGPYGGINSQRYLDNDRVLLLVGGSGAGFALPFIDMFARQAACLAKLQDAFSEYRNHVNEIQSP